MVHAAHLAQGGRVLPCRRDRTGVGAMTAAQGAVERSIIQFVPLRLHAAADYLVGASFFAVPLIADFDTAARASAWSVAAIHLTMTLLTDYPGGVVKWIPLRVHLTAELILGPVLAALPWLAGFSDDTAATALFVAWGAISFATYFVTDRTPT